MEQQKIGQNAIAYMQSGLSCAEATLKAVLEAFNANSNPAIPRVASGFGGGVGGTHDELCGAVSGGVMAMGYLLGRTNGAEDVQQLKDLAATFRQQFIDEYGTTHCQTLLDDFGPDETTEECRAMVGETAERLGQLLRDNNVKMHTTE